MKKATRLGNSIFVFTASTVEKVNFYVGTAQKALKKMGLTVDDYRENLIWL